MMMMFGSEVVNDRPLSSGAAPRIAAHLAMDERRLAGCAPLAALLSFGLNTTHQARDM
jgi:hypothetical protein